MKRIIKNIPLLFIIGCFLTGCLASSGSVGRQEQEIRALQGQIHDLQEQLQLQSLQYSKTLDQTRQTVPEIRMELDRLKRDMQGLRDHVERTRIGNQVGADGQTMDNQLNVIQQRVDRVESQLNLPPIPDQTGGMAPQQTMQQSMQQPLPPYGQSPVQQQQTYVQPNTPSQASDGTPDAAPVESNSGGPDALKFREAKSLFDMKAYREALPRFTDFLKEFPDSSLAPSAQLYIGECRYNTNDFEDAILAYQKVVKDYPDSKEVPHALTKQAFSFLSIGDKTSAEFLLKKVIRLHPDNYWAGVAQKKLNSL